MLEVPAVGCALVDLPGSQSKNTGQFLQKIRDEKDYYYYNKFCFAEIHRMARPEVFQNCISVRATIQQ